MSRPLPIQQCPVFKKSAVCIGIFDGIHRAHQRIIQITVREAKRRGLSPIALTFDPHPSKILRPEMPFSALYPIRHRLYWLKKLGLKKCLVIHFDRGFSRISAETFIREILVKKLGARFICSGSEFRFGHKAKGDFGLLKRASKQYGFTVRAVPPLRVHGKTVSSTRIRQLLESGKLLEASRLVGRPVSLYGRVGRGAQRGRLIGYPTVNLTPIPQTIPPQGVYAVWARVNGVLYPGALHIGPRPTFRERTVSIEAHLFCKPRSFYQKEIEIFLIKRIRSIRTFSSLQGLKEQISKDIHRVKTILNKVHYNLL